MKTPLLAFIGGFLGAGKTTLILRAAELLGKRGIRAAAIMNDQAPGLVDSRFAQAQDMNTKEVAGGCFCCRFSDLLDAAGQLLAYQPDIIFAEPVGSCIDLSATILQPLKAFHRGTFKLAPLTVLVDPEMAARVERSEVGADVQYLFRKQLAEADLVCLTKRDLCPHPRHVPAPIDFSLSAKTGEGVEHWLDEILSMGRVAGARLLDADYERYALAEAALGWLNLHADIHLLEPASPAVLCGPLLDDLDQLLTGAGISIAHLKVFDQTASGSIKASICTNGDTPVPEGDLLGEPARDHELAINLRALADPDDLRELTARAMAGIKGSVEIRRLSAFRPAAPKPEHRFATTVP